MSATLMKSKFVRRPSSVCRSSVLQLSLYPMPGFLSNLSCCFPWAICWDVFWNFEIFFTMEPNGSENFKQLLLIQKWKKKKKKNGFQVLLNFLPIGPHKLLGLQLEFWGIRFGFLKFWKCYSSYKFKPEVFKVEFSRNDPHKTTLRIFKILSFRFLMNCFFFSQISISPLSPIEKPKAQLTGKQEIVERNRVKFGIRR